jgi:molecular chaperone DnaK
MSTAAALAYGLHRTEGVDYILVYDFGGGTLDVSLLHVSDGFVDVMGSDGDDRLGGADFDAAVAHFLLEHRGGNAIVTV